MYTIQAVRGLFTRTSVPAAPEARLRARPRVSRTLASTIKGMVRFVIIGVVIAVALTLYALVDAAMTEGSRARGMNKPVWIVIIAVLPVIGALLWFFIGKGSAQAQATRRPAPDDDPRFSGTSLSSTDLDAHMRDLEDRLRELDDETFPGEEPTLARGGDGAETPDRTGDAASSDAAAARTSPAEAGAPIVNEADAEAEFDADADADAPPAVPDAVPTEESPKPRSTDEPGTRSDGDSKP